jgi:hypothetical protein
MVIDEPSDSSDIVLDLTYEGIHAFWNPSGWYHLSVQGPATYPFRGLPWGTVVTVEWISSRDECN